MNGGVTEPLAARIAKHSLNTTVQFLFPDGFVTRFSPPQTNARLIDRLVFSIVHSRDSSRTGGHPHIPVTRVVCEASTYLVCLSSPIPIRPQAACHFLMTPGGIDDESL
ncbi:hypothetical protein AAEP93_010824 [Penicillium crustosum]